MKRIGLVLCAVLGAALVGMAPMPADSALPSLPTATAGGGIMQYIPQNVTVLAGVSISKLAEAGLMDKLKEMGAEEALTALTELGIDPSKDITDLMLGVVINEEDPEGNPEVYIAVSGNFPAEDKFIAAYEKEEGEKPESRTVEGKTVYDMNGADVCFLPGVILVAPTEDAESDIAKMLAGATKSVAANTSMAALLKDANMKASVWGVAALPEALRNKMAENAEGAPVNISTLKTVVGSFDYAKKVALNIVLDFADEDTPTSLVETFDTQLKPMFGMMPGLGDILQVLTFKASGTKATINFEMDKDAFDTAIETLQKASGMGAGGVEGDNNTGDDNTGDDTDW
jgi:hypothetical protein